MNGVLGRRERACVHVTTCLCVPLPYVSLPAVLRPAPRVIDYPPRLARALHAISCLDCSGDRYSSSDSEVWRLSEDDPNDPYLFPDFWEWEF